MDRFIVMLPLLALPALFVTKSALPFLKKNTVMPPRSLVFIATSIHTMSAGTILVLDLVLFDIPSIPDLRESTMYLAVLALCAVLLRLYHRRRIEIIQSRPRGILVPILRKTALALAAVVLMMVWYLWSLQSSKFPESMV